MYTNMTFGAAKVVLIIEVSSLQRVLIRGVPLWRGASSTVHHHSKLNAPNIQYMYIVHDKSVYVCILYHVRSVSSREAAREHVILHSVNINSKIQTWRTVCMFSIFLIWNKK